MLIVEEKSVYYWWISHWKIEEQKRYVLVCYIETFDLEVRRRIALDVLASPLLHTWYYVKCWTKISGFDAHFIDTVSIWILVYENRKKNKKWFYDLFPISDRFDRSLIDIASSLNLYLNHIYWYPIDSSFINTVSIVLFAYRYRIDSILRLSTSYRHRLFFDTHASLAYNKDDNIVPGTFFSQSFQMFSSCEFRTRYHDTEAFSHNLWISTKDKNSGSPTNNIFENKIKNEKKWKLRTKGPFDKQKRSQHWHIDTEPNTKTNKKQKLRFADRPNWLSINSD